MLDPAIIYDHADPELYGKVYEPPVEMVAVLKKAMREAVALIDEINKRAPSRQFNGINQPLHAKLCTVRATLARALASTGAEHGQG